MHYVLLALTMNIRATTKALTAADMNVYKRSKDNFITGLPAELRNKIYELVLLNQGRRLLLWHPRGNSISKASLPGVLQVSRQIRTEALSIYFKGNDVIFECAFSHLGGIVPWLEDLRALGILTQQKAVNLEIFFNHGGQASWEPLIRYIYETDLGFESVRLDEEFWMGRFWFMWSKCTEWKRVEYDTLVEMGCFGCGGRVRLLRDAARAVGSFGELFARQINALPDRVSYSYRRGSVDRG